MDIIKDRGAHTKGRAARAVAGSSAVEIKATVPSHQVQRAEDYLHVNTDGHLERFIYFFDTPELALFKQGIVARARRRVGGRHDSTIKFRPVDPDDIPERWREFEGFKVETDASDRAIVRSASLTCPVKRGLIKAVAYGEARVAELFTEEQVAFLLTLADKRFDPDEVVVLGPVQAFKWRLEVPALPWPLCAELWKRPDGEQLMEVSIKAPAVQAAVAYYGFMAWLAEIGAERDDAQQAKTRWALEWFAKQHQPAAAATGASEV